MHDVLVWYFLEHYCVLLLLTKQSNPRQSNVFGNYFGVCYFVLGKEQQRYSVAPTLFAGPPDAANVGRFRHTFRCAGYLRNAIKPTKLANCNTHLETSAGQFS